MALTVTSRGTGTDNTSATTLVPGGRNATIPAGSMGVLAIALDNAGAQGANLIAPATWTDAKGNTWTERINALYDNGAASAGIEMVFYTAPITVDLLTTDAGTITWNASASPTAKAWTWYQITPSGANSVGYSTGGNIAGATAANAQVTTASVLVGDAVIAGYFSENVNAVTGDSDTTNGTWGTQQTATVGSGTSGVRIATQHKVQTTTASTQSYDVTVASQDRIAGYIMLHEVVNTVVTPGVASLTTTTYAPVIKIGVNPIPGVKNLAITAYAPTVTATNNPRASPPYLVPDAISGTYGSGTVSSLSDDPSLGSDATYVSAVTSIHLVVDFPTPSWSLSSTASALKARFRATGDTPIGVAVYDGASQIASTTATGGLDEITFSLSSLSDQTGAGLQVHFDADGVASESYAVYAVDFRLPASPGVTVTPGVANLTTTRYAPAVSAPRLVTPSVAALTTTTYAPTVIAPALVVPALAALSTSAFIPAVTASQHILVTPPTTSLSLTAYSPVAQTPNLVVPGLATLSISAFAPVVDRAVVPANASLALTTFAPVALAPRRVEPPMTALNITTYFPQVGLYVVPTTNSLAISTFAPTVSTPNVATPSIVALSLATFAPSVTATAHQWAIPDTKALTLAGIAPTATATQNILVQTGLATLTTTAFSPSAYSSDAQVFTPATKAFTLTGLAPVVTATAHVVVVPGVESTALSALAPSVNLGIIVPALSLSLSAFVPDVSSHQNVTVVPGRYILATVEYAPSVSATNNQRAVPSTASVSTTTYAANVIATANVWATPDRIHLPLAGFAPIVTASNAKVVTPDSRSLNTALFAPSVITPRTVTPDAASLIITPLAPTSEFSENALVRVGVAALVLETFIPNVSYTKTRPGTATYRMVSGATAIATMGSRSAVTFTSPYYATVVIR